MSEPLNGAGPDAAGAVRRQSIDLAVGRPLGFAIAPQVLAHQTARPPSEPDLQRAFPILEEAVDVVVREAVAFAQQWGAAPPR